MPTPETPSASPSPPGPERILAWIMAAIVVWGLFHAVGAWMLNHDARRPLIVIACVAAFLGFWLAMLAARRRRLAHLQDGAREQRR
jgi:type VI protein secretion system component VasK